MYILNKLPKTTIVTMILTPEYATIVRIYSKYMIIIQYFLQNHKF